MASKKITTKTEVKTTGFVPQWPTELDLKPIHSVQISPRHRADIYFDSEMRERPNYQPYRVIVSPESRNFFGENYETLLAVRLALNALVVELNKTSRKYTRVESDDGEDED